jgi:hypothetical protein
MALMKGAIWLGEEAATINSHRRTASCCALGTVEQPLRGASIYAEIVACRVSKYVSHPRSKYPHERPCTMHGQRGVQLQTGRSEDFRVFGILHNMTLRGADMRSAGATLSYYYSHQSNG